MAETFRLVLEAGESAEICFKFTGEILREPYSSVVVGEGVLVREGEAQKIAGHMSVTVLHGPATISIVKRGP